MPARRVKNPMFAILWSLQRISRIRRQFLGKTVPHWLKDGSTIISYVNFLSLMPTLLASRP